MESLIADDLMSMRQCARLLGVSTRCVEYRVHSRKLPSVLVGTVRLVRLSDVASCPMKHHYGRPRSR
jgi:excisionase family DNA binding protein